MTKNPMKNLPASAPDTVDVVAESNYGTTSEAYNKAFRIPGAAARRTNMRSAARKRTKEAVYVEGKGYHEPDPAAEERRAIMQINMVIGMALFAFLLIENLLTALLMGAAQVIGLDVGYCYSDGTVYGNQTAVLAILMLKTILKYLVPILIFRLTFRDATACGISSETGCPTGIPGDHCGHADYLCRDQRVDAVLAHQLPQQQHAGRGVLHRILYAAVLSDGLSGL